MHQQSCHAICRQLDQSRPASAPTPLDHAGDRPSWPRPPLRKTQAASVPSWAGGLATMLKRIGETVRWYLTHQEWCIRAANIRVMTADWALRRPEVHNRCEQTIMGEVLSSTMTQFHSQTNQSLARS